MKEGLREGRLRLAALLMVVGLAVELFSLQRSTANSFLAFALVGAVAVLAGIAVAIFSRRAGERS